MLYLDSPDIRDCEHGPKYNNQDIYTNFIDEKIFVCDTAFRPLNLVDLKTVFKEWICCIHPGYKYQFSELVPKSLEKKN